MQQLLLMGTPFSTLLLGFGSGSTAHLLRLDSQVQCPPSHHLQLDAHAAEANHGAFRTLPKVRTHF